VPLPKNDPNAYDPNAPLSPSERGGLLEIRRRRRTVYVCMAALMPTTLFASLVVPAIAIYVMGVGMAVFFVSIVRHGFARCPRCDERFNWMNPWTRECMWCGLSLGKLPKPADERGIKGGMM
jgi:hypothetical protein